jgi:hypothetical protein
MTSSLTFNPSFFISRAGKYFSDAVAMIGVNVVIAMIAHTTAKGVNAKLKAPTGARKSVTAKHLF